MNEIIGPSSDPLPLAARVAITVRVATLADVPFIDGLQKKQARQVGFFPTKAIEGKIAAGQVIVAEAGEDRVTRWQGDKVKEVSPCHPVTPSPGHTSPLGYLIGQDQYFKRDDVGVIYQINVLAEYRRSLVAATLLKAQFERSAWGCKLYCCWCAQDIEANRFWESMGFVPLAFRAGSEKKGRTHIFWQKRIRQGDDATPWWFPSKTSGGAIGEDRIVLPIPPGVGWRDVMPRMLPQEGDDRRDAEDAEKKGKHGRAARSTGKAVVSSKPPVRAVVQFGPPGMEPMPMVTKTNEAASDALAKTAKREKPKRARRKCDPKIVAAARELRDRWLDAVNAGQANVPLAVGKYEVCRPIGTTPATKRLVA
jgi:hypothetical protein